MLYKCPRMLACIITVNLGAAVIHGPVHAESNLGETFPEFARQIAEGRSGGLVDHKLNSTRRHRPEASLGSPQRSRGSAARKFGVPREMTAGRTRKRSARTDPSRRTASRSGGAKTATEYRNRSKSNRFSSGRLNPKRAAGGASRGYGALIARHARANGVPIALAHAVVRIESGYRAHARGRAGEVGLMQIKPATARIIGYRGAARGLYDPDTNLRWGMRYLGAAYRRAGGDICGAILRYNAGHYARRMNRISARYCRRARRLMNDGRRT